MSRRGFRVVVASVSFVAWTGTATRVGAERAAAREPARQLRPAAARLRAAAALDARRLAAEPAPIEADIAPGFMTLDRVDADTRLGLQVGFIKLDDIALSDGFLMRFNPYGQYVFPGKTGGHLRAAADLARVRLNGADSTGIRQPRDGRLLPAHALQRSDPARRPGRGDRRPTTTSAPSANIVTDVRAADRLRLDRCPTTPPCGCRRRRSSRSASSSSGRTAASISSSTGRAAPATAPASSSARTPPRGYRVPDAVDLAFELVNLAAVNGDVTGGITERFAHTAAIQRAHAGRQPVPPRDGLPARRGRARRGLDPVVRLPARDELSAPRATGARSSPGTGSSRRRCCCRARAAA